jgi:hypothetical protein
MVYEKPANLAAISERRGKPHERHVSGVSVFVNGKCRPMAAAAGDGERTMSWQAAEISLGVEAKGVYRG